MNLIERKFETNKFPQVGDKIFNNERLYIQATGCKIKMQPITGTYYVYLDKKYFIARDGKGNWINGKIVGEYL